MFNIITREKIQIQIFDKVFQYNTYMPRKYIEI